MKNNVSQVVLVKDIDPGSNYSGRPGSSNPDNLTEVDGLLYFSANDGENGRELWVSDGTDEGTVLVADINPDSSYGYGSSSYPYSLTEVGNKLYFTADDGENGRELWVSDGTDEGTVLVKDINPDSSYGYGSSSYPYNLTEVNGLLYFTANDGDNGRELWVSDGTNEGTVLVKDINPDSSYGYGRSSYPYSLTEFDGLLYFSTNDGDNGRELWVSDGTDEGTVLVKDINPGGGYGYGSSSYPGNLIEVDGLLYFSANDGDNGSELWVSDGTDEGTVLVADINPDSSYGYGSSSYPYSLTEVGNKLYFTADDGENGRELWVSDGTDEGTVLVKDINPNPDSSYGYGSDSSPYNLTEVDGLLYFSANDGENGRELWVSDGTNEGTVLVKDINPGSNYGYIHSSNPRDFTEFDGLLYFTANDGENGRELWVSDGTSEGTVLVTDLNSLVENDGTPYSSDPTNLTVIGEELFFSASDGENGRELFKLTSDDFNTNLTGTGGADNLIGTDDADEIDGLSGRDTIKGGAGNDTLTGGSGSDELFGETGDDTLNGGSGRDILNGGGGDDALYGDRGNDNLFGAIGDDTLDGGKGNDTLNGSGGNDVLTGGGGSDVFILQSNRGKDIITDFDLSRDIISLAKGLDFDDLSFSDNKIIANEQILATLDGINTQELTPLSFEQFEI